MRYARFEDLPVWNTAIELAVGVYALTSRPYFRSHRTLRDQIELETTFQVQGFKFQVHSGKGFFILFPLRCPMATFKKFEDIDAWQEARELTNGIYRLTGQGDFSKDYGLKDQIRRASVSIMSNIAEGFERSGTGEFGRPRRALPAKFDRNFT